MFKDNKSFSSFSVNDIEVATKFYSDILGLAVSRNSMGVLNISGKSGNDIIIYPKPDHVPATFTVLNFVVDDIEKSVDDLTARGIRFLQYDGAIETDAKGICYGHGKGPDIAWFTDPAGNILSVLASKE